MSTRQNRSAVTKRIIVVGGGFGGLYAALQLDRTIARDPGVEVLLIDPQNFTVFTPMLRVLLEWTPDLLFARDTVQILTLRGARPIHLSALMAPSDQTLPAPEAAVSTAEAMGSKAHKIITNVPL